MKNWAQKRREKRHAEYKRKGCNCLYSGIDGAIYACPLHGWDINAKREWRGTVDNLYTVIAP